MGIVAACVPTLGPLVSSVWTKLGGVKRAFSCQDYVPSAHVLPVYRNQLGSEPSLVHSGGHSLTSPHSIHISKAYVVSVE